MVGPGQEPDGGTEYIREHGIYLKSKTEPMQDVKQEGGTVLFNLARND